MMIMNYPVMHVTLSYKMQTHERKLLLLARHILPSKPVNKN